MTIIALYLSKNALELLRNSQIRIHTMPTTRNSEPISVNFFIVPRSDTKFVLQFILTLHNFRIKIPNGCLVVGRLFKCSRCFFLRVFFPIFILLDCFLERIGPFGDPKLLKQRIVWNNPGALVSLMTIVFVPAIKPPNYGITCAFYRLCLGTITSEELSWL